VFEEVFSEQAKRVVAIPNCLDVLCLPKTGD
jgi:hypothetical protein